MYAVIDIGGKQYKVEKGDVIFVERLGVEENSSFSFNNVVALVDDGRSVFGAPFVEGASVSCNVIKNGKRKKIRVFKYKPKKNYSRRIGHRQLYSKVQITDIKTA